MKNVYIVTWPLGINEEMDNHAAVMGFSHWSCVERFSNSYWLRRDGEFVQWLGQSSYIDELKSTDVRIPFIIPHWALGE